MFSPDYTLTKAQLGWLALAAGLIGFVAVFSLDLVVLARANGVASLFSAATLDHLRSPLGIGPAQRLALLVCGVVAVFGATLIPLGNRPA
jgi:hypothetical protein